MKKIILSAILCVGILVPTIAQEASNPALVNKRGIALLPEAGDYALGIDASPFLYYLGNMFFTGEGMDNYPPYFSGVAPSQSQYGIYGKYFLENDRAIRAKVSFDFGQNKYKQTVKDEFALAIDPLNEGATTVDVRQLKNRSIYLDLGYEFRRGKGRIQGFYGGELLLGYGRTINNYIYGNPLTDVKPNPATHNFGSNTTGLTQGTRMLQNKGGATFAAGLGGFVGVEYFFAPQLSIGGELGLDFIYSITGQDEIKTEGMLNGQLQEYKYRSRNATNSSFETSFSTRPAGSIFLMFHF